MNEIDYGPSGEGHIVHPDEVGMIGDKEL